MKQLNEFSQENQSFSLRGISIFFAAKSTPLACLRQIRNHVDHRGMLGGDYFGLLRSGQNIAYAKQALALHQPQQYASHIDLRG